MSRSKPVRALLAAATLFGAWPLLAQTSARPVVVRPPAAATFPYGKFTLQPAPGAAADPVALTVEFIDGAMKVYKQGELTRSDGMIVAGDRWQVWQDSGPCATPQSIGGTYRWSFVDGVLAFSLVEDACPGRSEKVLATRLVRIPSAVPAAAPSASSFPFGRYLIQPLEGGSQNGAGLFVEIGPLTTKVFNGADLLETHGSAVDGAIWRIFELTGECLDKGSYHWHFADGALTFEIITDPCGPRAANVSTVRLLRAP